MRRWRRSRSIPMCRSPMPTSPISAGWCPPTRPHQGVVIEVDALEDVWLGDLLDEGAETQRPLIILDQVTDPHNVGAILRSAAAFDALGLVTQDRHAPGETGVLARAAAGALETMPWVRVVNLARAMDEIGEAGFWRIGLTGDAPRTLADALGTARVALVLGAEGDGMRHNTVQHCDALARLPIHGAWRASTSPTPRRWRSTPSPRAT